mmetsp:Transcript_21278/g.29479  ORF Transcript_21278/g.29479 Transcript_21278/m.29479 type:complete len:87 (-) Transcript_21278:78-338(-)
MESIIDGDTDGMETFGGNHSEMNHFLVVGSHRNGSKCAERNHFLVVITAEWNRFFMSITVIHCFFHFSLSFEAICLFPSNLMITKS